MPRLAACQLPRTARELQRTGCGQAREEKRAKWTAYTPAATSDIHVRSPDVWYRIGIRIMIEGTTGSFTLDFGQGHGVGELNSGYDGIMEAALRMRSSAEVRSGCGTAMQRYYH